MAPHNALSASDKTNPKTNPSRILQVKIPLLSKIISQMSVFPPFPEKLDFGYKYFGMSETPPTYVTTGNPFSSTSCD